MCGRFENKVREDWMQEKFAEFNLTLIFRDTTDNRKFENIAPTNSIVAIMNDEEDLFGSANKWGIKFSVKLPLIFNSRIETILEKHFWKMLFDKNRCIVPMTAFFEWKKDKTKKVPYRISLKKEEMFFVPGLYNKDKEGNKTISLITTQPNDFMKNIHNRMPVILDLKEAIEYLNADVENNFEKCLPYKYTENMQMEIAKI
jgi:putative SOS response-associated peptidase YedK